MKARKLLVRRVVALATASSVAVGMSFLGLGAMAAHADSSQPVTFSITSGGSLVLFQDNTLATALTNGSAAPMPVTTVTDSRNATDRTAAYAVTASASALTNGTTAQDIPSGASALARTSASFTTGSGTASSPTVASFTVSGDSINSVYTYTPTDTLTVPANQFSGNYTGSVGQTAV